MLARLYGLEALPVELLYEIQLYALSHTLPHTSQHLHRVFEQSPSSFRAQYVIARSMSTQWGDPGETFTRILRYPLCTQGIFTLILRYLAPDPETRYSCDLPRRLFRSLVPKSGSANWTEDDEPLPFLRHLYQSKIIHSISVNAHDGYALTRAVHAKFKPLVRFLLDHEASPRFKANLAVMVAVRQKDLSLVKMLIERESDGKDGKGKRRKLEDRLPTTPAMLKAAVRCDASDIVEYLTQEKGVVPDMQTLQYTLKAKRRGH